MELKELKAHRASLIEKREALIRQVHVLDGAAQEADFWIAKIEKESAEKPVAEKAAEAK